VRGVDEGEWTATAGPVAPSRGWRANHDELRFSMWLARVAWRGGRPLDALTLPLRIAKRGLVDFATQRASSANDLSPEIETSIDGLLVRSALAYKDGSRVADTAIERRYTIDGAGLSVAENLVSSGACSAIDYSVPEAATAVVRSLNAVSYRLS